jgi:hypothetical protein
MVQQWPYVDPGPSWLECVVDDLQKGYRHKHLRGTTSLQRNMEMAQAGNDAKSQS